MPRHISNDKINFGLEKNSILCSTISKVMRGHVVKPYKTVPATVNKKSTAQNKQRDFEKRSKW